MAEDLLSGEEYKKFKASDYLKGRYDNPDSKFIPSLRCYHEVFKSLPSGLTVLDYGTGPAIITTISASTKASELVLSDYAEDSREVLRRWLDRHPDAFDWSPFFRLVVKDLEGKGEKEVEERQELVRSLVKAVVHCDLTQDPPIERGYDRQYDVVISGFCLESVARTHAEYKRGVDKLAKLVKPGGLLLLEGGEVLEGRGGYMVGDHTFEGVGVTRELAEEAMKEAGMSDITVKDLTEPRRGSTGSVWIFRFFKGTKRTKQTPVN